MPLEKIQRTKVFLKLKQDPALGLLFAFENFREEALQLIKMEISQLKNNLPVDLTLEGIKKLRGDPGKTPTKEELVALIKSVMPPVVHGKTPTSQEVLSLIRPLIPEVKDGKTPSSKELLDLIKPLIPQIDLSEDLELIESKLVKTLMSTLMKGEVASEKKIRSVQKELESQYKKTLKKLSDEFRNALRQRGGGSSGGGGGMGNWTHEQFSLTSATTSVTLSKRVAANSTAIMVRYQGQMLHHNVLYSVSSKTITLLFTPENSTTLDVTYVRT